MKNILKEVNIPGGQGKVSLVNKDGEIIIERIAERARIRNYVAQYEYIDKSGASQLRKMTEEVGNEILNRIESGTAYSSSYIFYEDEASLTTDLEITDMEHQYTSTGIKFWRHQEAMLNYQNGDPNSVISTHISSEGACNLKCPYCSVNQ